MADDTRYLPPTTQAYATALLGPAFMIVHFTLAGVLFAQFSAYLATELYRKDPPSLKRLVWAVVLLDVTNMAFNAEQMIHYGISQQRDFWSVYIIRAVDFAPFVLTAASAALLQSFLARRASKLFNSNMTAQLAFVATFYLLIAFTFLAQVGELALGLLLSRDPTADTHGFTLNITSGIWLWGSTAIDCSLSVALLLILRRRFEGNLSSIRNVVRVSFQTALLTSVFSLAGAVSATAWPQSNVTTANVVMAFGLPLSSLYALSLIVTLASRQERVVEVRGTTLAGYHQTPLLDGLAGAKPGLPHSGQNGVPLVVLARRDLAESDDEEDEAGADGKDLKNGGRGPTRWQDEDKEIDVELGTEDDEGGLSSVRRSETRSTTGARRLQSEAAWRVRPRDRSTSSDRRRSLHVGFA